MGQDHWVKVTGAKVCLCLWVVYLRFKGNLVLNLYVSFYKKITVKIN